MFLNRPPYHQKGKTHLGCSRASQQLGKPYQYKAWNTTTSRGAMPARAERYSERDFFSDEFRFLTVSEREGCKMMRE